MILIYLPRPINSHNTIMRKGRLAVLFLGSIFPKSLKMHSQVKSLLTEPLYLLTLRLFDIFISNNTHRLLAVSTTSCRSRAENRELTIRQGLAPRRWTSQRVDWIEYFIFRANFDRYERAHTLRTSLAGTSRPRTNCCCSVGSLNSHSVWKSLTKGSYEMNYVV